jgi:hypothetical protein
MAVSSSSVLWKVPRRIIRPVIRAKNRSTWFSHELLVGVKWKWNLLRFLRLQPALHLCAFVSAVIVHDEMHFLFGRQLRFQMVEEPYKFPTAVAVLTGADHFAVENIERGEQGGGAMAFIVVRLTLRQAGAQRQNRSGAIQSLNLALLIHAQYQGTFGRIQIQANDVPDLFLKVRIAGQFELLHTMWLHVVTLPDSVNDASGDPQFLASIRTLQCVLPSPGRVFTVVSTIFCSSSGVNTLPRRCRLRMPVTAANPSFAKAPRNARIVGRDTPNCSAMD